MENNKIIVDILSSIASLVAILTFLIVWINSKRKPLSIEYMVINGNDSYTFYMKNRRDYPITINVIRCFTQKNYRLEQVCGQKPQLSASFSINGLAIESAVKKTIDPKASDSITYKANYVFTNAKEYMVLLDTSHGYFELNCKKISVISSGTKLMGVSLLEEFSSKRKAYKRFLIAYCKYYFSSSK